MKDENELVENNTQLVPVEEKTTALTVVDQNQNLMSLLEKKRQEEEFMKKVHDELVSLREQVTASSDSSEISALSTRMNEISDQLDQMLENTDRDYSPFESVLAEVEKQIKEIQEAIARNEKAYLESYERIRILVGEQTSTLHEALTQEELDKRVQELMQEKIAENEESLSIREEIIKQAEELRKLVRKRNRVRRDLQMAQQLGVSAAEYKEITDNFRSRKLAYAIIRQEGLGDILDIPYKDRTPEQKRRIQAIRKNIIARLAEEKKKHADESILNIVEALYGIETEVHLKGRQRVLIVKPKALENIRRNASKLPEKIKNSDTIEVTYTPGEAPDDMKDVMESSTRDSILTDKFTFFRDERLPEKTFARTAVFTRFAIQPIGSEMTVDGASCYEISPTDLERIISNANNDLSPYVVEFKNAEVYAKTTALTLQKEQVTDLVVPHKLVIKPDMEKIKKAIEERTAAMASRTETPIPMKEEVSDASLVSTDSSPDVGDEQDVEKVLVNQENIMKESIQKDEIPSQEVAPVTEDALQDSSATVEFIPGTTIPKPRNRGVDESDEDYVAFLKEYYDRAFEPKEDVLSSEEVVSSDEHVIEKVLTNHDSIVKEPIKKEEMDSQDSIVKGVDSTEQVVSPIVEEDEDTLDRQTIVDPDVVEEKDIQEEDATVPPPTEDESDEFIPGTNFRKPRYRGVYETDQEYEEFLARYYERIFGPQAVKSEDKVEIPVVEEERGLTDKIVLYKDTETPDRFYAYKPVFDRFNADEIGDEVRLDGIAGYEISASDVERILANQDNDLSPYIVEMRNITFEKEEEMDSRRGLEEGFIIYRDTERPNTYYAYDPVFDRFDVEPLGEEVRLDGVVGHEIDALDVQDILDNQENDYSPYTVEFRDVTIDRTMTTDPPAVDTDSPVVNTDPPAVDTDSPVVNTDPPIENTDPPVVNTDPPIENTDPPVKKTTPPVVETTPPKKPKEEVITLYRDVNDNDQVYAPDEVMQRFEIKALAAPTMIKGKPCHKISRDTDQIINSIAKMSKDPKLVVKYENVKVKEIVPTKPRPHVEDILDKLTTGLDIRAKDCTRYRASNLKIAKGFKEELKSGNYAYNIVHVIPALLKAGIGFFRKLSGKLLTSARAKDAMKTIEDRLSKLTDEELDVLFEEYKGSQLKTDMNNQINPLILDRLRQHGLARVDKLNDQIRKDYTVLFSLLGQIKALEERMKKSGKEKGSLETQRQALMKQASVHVQSILENRKKADNLLSSGVHGLEEDFKAVATRLSYVGMRFAKTNDFNNDLQHQLGLLGRRLNTALAEGDDEAIVQNFMGLETCYYENTEIRGSLAGKRSVGSKYYSPIAEQFDYRADPFIRDLFTTIAVTSAAVSAVNAIRVHQLEVHDHQAEIDRINAQNRATMDQVHQTASEISGKRSTFQEGMQAQAQQDILTNADVRERAHLDLTNWQFNNAYHAADHAGHDAFNQFNIDVTNQMNAVTSDYASGLITQAQALERMAQISSDAQTTLHDVIDSSLAILKPYAASHPQFDLTAVEQSMEYLVAHPNAIADMNQAMVDVTNLADGLQGLQAAELSGLGALPSDMASTLVCAASAVCLASNVSSTMQKAVKKGTYGNEVTEMMDEYLAGALQEEEGKEKTR